MNKPKFIYWGKYLTEINELTVKYDLATIAIELGHLNSNWQGNLSSLLIELDKELIIYNDRRERGQYG